MQVIEKGISLMEKGEKRKEIEFKRFSNSFICQFLQPYLAYFEVFSLFRFF
jgi:hypothetical protein